MIASTTKINEGGYCSSNQFEGSNGRVRGVSGAGAINPPAPLTTVRALKLYKAAEITKKLRKKYYGA